MRILLFCRLNTKTKLTHLNTESGFTLIELLLIVVMIGVLSIAAINAFDGNEEQARQNITRLEMAELQKALLQFRRDNRELPCMVYDKGDFSPNTVNITYGTENHTDFREGFDLDSVPSSAAEWVAWCHDDYLNAGNDITASNALTMLNQFPYQEVADFDFLLWNASTQLGWNGAYISEEGLTDGWGNPYLLIDPELAYNQSHRCLVDSNDYDRTSNLYQCLAPSDAGFSATDHILPANIARIISTGPDGVLNTDYDPNPALDEAPCIAEGDDLVLCLLR